MRGNLGSDGRLPALGDANDRGRLVEAQIAEHARYQSTELARLATATGLHAKSRPSSSRKTRPDGSFG